MVQTNLLNPWQLWKYKNLQIDPSQPERRGRMRGKEYIYIDDSIEKQKYVIFRDATENQNHLVYKPLYTTQQQQTVENK